ncbi:putative splicing factor 3b, subunit 3, partial [Cardiosporidium cionae]
MPILYNLTLQRPTAIPQAIYGNFSAPRAHEILVSRGTVLELLRPDDLGKLHCIATEECFGIIRSISTFRLTGSTRDYIVMCSDSARLVILDYNVEKNCFDRIHCETYGKTGIRRIVPGEYLAVDPKGRALMIGAVERQKFVYILNRDSQANITICSPLEAHKSHMICHALSSVDTGFENPMFASLEQNYETSDENAEKGVSFWEMDLGLNHVIKKATVPVDITAHCLIPIPGGGGIEGPSGVLICCEFYMVYKRLEHEDVFCSFPRRLEMGQDKGILIVSWAVHKMKDFFFVLIQSEYGDLYKVEISHDDNTVNEISCRYFDTVPVGNSICVLKSGYLFVASEFGNHLFYQFTGIGTDDTDPMCTSSHPLGKDATIAFKPRGLKNLQLYDEIQSLSPITDMKIFDAQSAGYPQIYALCGRGPRSSLRILQHGLSVEEMADNELPGRPRAVWTIKENTKNIYDGFIIVGFEGSTLILSIGDTVEEITETSFLRDVTTLHVALLYEDSFVQIHENGIRHILNTRVHEWKVPAGKRIKVATSNDRQVMISLSGGELIQFEVDESHTLIEVGRKNLNVETTCMAVQPVPEGRSRGSFVAVGGLDNVVRLLSLEIDRNLRLLTSQALPSNATAESVCLIRMKGVGQSEDSSNLYLNVGLNTGVMLRSVVDITGGQLSDQRT